MDQRARRRLLNYYEAASVVVWAALLIGVAVVLQGTAYFGQLLAILMTGAAFFVVVLPAALGRLR